MDSRRLDVLSYLAVWPGLYVASGVVCLVQVAGIKLPPERLLTVLLVALLTGIATYLLDRVKIRDAWLDPADHAAHAARFDFIRRHAGAVRGGAVAALIAGSGLAWRLPAPMHWPVFVPAMSALGVVAYALRPRSTRPRPKDSLTLKNLYVATGITTFALLVGLAGAGAETRAGAMEFLLSRAVVFSAAMLLVRVWADAALCDLDDREADRQFDTSTLATRFGHGPAWNIAFGVRLALAMALILIPIGPPLARIAWGIATAVSSIALRIASPALVRDWVDVRFSLEALGVTVFLAMA